MFTKKVRDVNYLQVTAWENNVSLLLLVMQSCKCLLLYYIPCVSTRLTKSNWKIFPLSNSAVWKENNWNAIIYLIFFDSS